MVYLAWRDLEFADAAGGRLMVWHILARDHFSSLLLWWWLRRDWKPLAESLGPYPWRWLMCSAVQWSYD